MNEWLFVGIGVLLTIGTGFFVASEFSLVSLDRADLEARRDAGEGGFTLAIQDSGTAGGPGNAASDPEPAQSDALPAAGG